MDPTGLQVDDSGWPLLVLRAPAMANEAVVRALIDAFERAFERESRFAVVLDGSASVRFPGPSERTIIADWLADERRVERERRWNLGTAVVIASLPMRALVSAFNLVRRPASPQHWVATLPEGLRWARERLHEAGIVTVPRIEPSPPARLKRVR